MDTLMIIIVCLMIITCLIFSIYTIFYNKLQDYIIRINEVESMIDDNSRNKYDNINKYIAIMKGTKKIENDIDPSAFDEIIRIRTQKFSNFDIDRKLIEVEIFITELKEKYKELKESEELTNLEKKREELDENLIVNKEYYNRNIAEYNKLIKQFPTNIIAKIGKYEEKLFYDRKDMSDDDFNDFKL